VTAPATLAAEAKRTANTAVKKRLFVTGDESIMKLQVRIFISEAPKVAKRSKDY
jgi:hypothetical protein